MKYLFGDSTEFPMQIDFLRLANNFIDTSVKVVTLENSVLEMKEDINEKRRYMDSVLAEMDGFLLTVDNAISEAVTKSREKEMIARYAQKSRESLKRIIEDGKAKFSDETSQKIAQLEEQIKGTNEDSRKIMEAFFIQDPIPVINKKFVIKITEKGNSANVLAGCEGNVSYMFEIALSDQLFWKWHVRARDFVRGIEIPARMKKPFLKKEAVPEIVNLDDYYLSDLVLSGKELEVVFRKNLNNASERFRLKMNMVGEFTVEVFHAVDNGTEKNLQDVEELKDALNIPDLRELGEKIIEEVNNLYQKKQRLVSLCLSSKDVFEDNLMFDLMQKVAEIFAPTVAEIKSHSPSREELSLKAEDETGKRSEIYLKKSQAGEKLGEIKEKGDRLFGILGIPEGHG